jgi:DNA-binding transcriptional ArsR family regulator
MGTSKLTLFTNQQNALAMKLKALGHPARIAIVEQLLRHPGCICGDLVAELPLAQATISQHLKELKAAGIIQGTIEGTRSCYCLNSSAIEALQLYFKQINTILDEHQHSSC